MYNNGVADHLYNLNVHVYSMPTLYSNVMFEERVIPIHVTYSFTHFLLRKMFRPLTQFLQLCDPTCYFS